MPVVIGASSESTFANPIGLLKDCHRRIERFLSVLAQVCGNDSLTQEQRASLDTALRYFREAAPKHTADEEDSLFPRLRSMESAEVKAMLAQLDSLEDDHSKADTIHAEIDRLGRQWLEAGSLPPTDSARFSALVTDLAELYRAHIAIEEGQLFPLAAAVLQQPERDAIGEEMSARRGLRRP